MRLVLDDVTLARKVAALRAHRSQTQAVEQIVGSERFARWWDEECFVDAVPGGAAGVGTLPKRDWNAGPVVAHRIAAPDAHGRTRKSHTA